MDSDGFTDPSNIRSTSESTTRLQNLNSLPFNRREMDQWNTEFSTAVEYNPKMINLFDKPPTITLKDSNDAESIRQMTEYFITKNSRKRQLVETVDKNSEMSGNHIKKQLCHIDLEYQQSQQLKYEIEQLREEFADLNSKTQMLQKENGALKTRLSKYQATDVIDRQRNQDARNRAKKKDAALEKQRQVIQQVENFLDERPGAVATLRKRFDLKENAQKSATISKNRPPRGPPSVTTISTSSSGSNGSNVPIYSTGRQPGPHRRSQSVQIPIRSRK